METARPDHLPGDPLKATTDAAKEKPVNFRFFAVPGYQIAEPSEQLRAEELVEPSVPHMEEAVEQALSGAEFRDMRAPDRLRALLSTPSAPRHTSPGGCGPAVVFAQPPQDLPALLRLADQLDSLAALEQGERALVWKCAQCGSRYAVPVSLVRAVSIRCERCTATIDLVAERCLGEETLVDPFKGAVNTTRRELAGFFREAMARGWPVLVCAAER